MALRELRGTEHAFYFEHAKNIPQCFNSVSLSALLDKDFDWTHGWFIEEDVVVPDGALSALLALDADLAAIDYPLKVGKSLSHREADNRVCWMSLGCTLVKRRVFDVLPVPYFRSDRKLVAIYDGSAAKGWRFELRQRERPDDYGNQDVYFSGQALIHDLSMRIVPLMLCDHLDLNDEALLGD